MRGNLIQGLVVIAAGCAIGAYLSWLLGLIIAVIGIVILLGGVR